jgi:hypothetical protein
VLPLHHGFAKRTTRVERASPEWRSGALPAELRPRSTPGWSRTSGLCRRRTALCPLSYGRVMETVGVEPTSASLQARCSARLSYIPVCRSLRQESNPHLGRTKGACLPLTLRRRTGGVEPPQREATGLQPAELAGAQRPQEGWPAGLEPALSGVTAPGASVYTTTTMSGDDRARTGGLSPDKRVLSSSELRPRMSFAERRRQ